MAKVQERIAALDANLAGATKLVDEATKAADTEKLRLGKALKAATKTSERVATEVKAQEENIKRFKQEITKRIAKAKKTFAAAKKADMFSYR